MKDKTAAFKNVQNVIHTLAVQRKTKSMSYCTTHPLAVFMLEYRLWAFIKLKLKSQKYVFRLEL
jgi:hypothetical protein